MNHGPPILTVGLAGKLDHSHREAVVIGNRNGRRMEEYGGSRFPIRLERSAAHLGIEIAVVISAFGVLSTTVASATASVGKWTQPTSTGSVTKSANQVSYSVSCPSSSICVAVNGDGQVACRRNGKWTAPVALSVGGSIDAVSCSSSTFCVALAGGNATMFNGHNWTSARHVSPAGDTFKIACITSTFCAAVGAGMTGKPSVVLTFNGHSWKT